MSFAKFNHELFEKFRQREALGTKFSVGAYDLVNCVIKDGSIPRIFENPELGDHPYAMAFTSNEKMSRYIDTSHLVVEVSTRPWTLCALCQEFENSETPTFVVINPFFQGEEFLFDRIVVAPIYSQLLRKKLISDPQDALALLAIDPRDEERLRIKSVFYALTNRELPEEPDERALCLQKKIEEFAFLVARTPVEKGSGSFITAILNLEHLMEETAFIRPYQTMDSYSDVIFVNSDFSIKAGDLSKIPYNGDNIDTIFVPLIDWQKTRQQN